MDRDRHANALLEAMPPAERAKFTAAGEVVPLASHQPLAHSHQRYQYVYFPLSGVVSYIAETEDGDAAEVTAAGREGMVGIGIALGDTVAPFEVMVEVPGEAHRIPADRFAALLRECPSAQSLLYRYANTLLTASAQTIVCNSAHRIEQRCARWFLTTHDRVDGDTFPITQEFLAAMLAMRRPSVTQAARALKDAGLIEYRRGVVTVLNRPGLEQAACECYGAVRKFFDRFYGT